MQPSANGRNRAGRFTRGNPGGPGNPHGAATARFRAALLAGVSGDDFDAIVRKVVELAQVGDLRAARLILEYCCGKPVQPVMAEGMAETGRMVMRLEFDDRQ